MIFERLKNHLSSLHHLLSKLTEEQFVQQINHLSHANIGGHTRHIIELLQCAVNGYDIGCIDYENRSRDLELERNIAAAQSAITFLLINIKQPDKPLKIVLSEEKTDLVNCINTNYYRELLYHTEHTLHHLALIKVALIDMHLDLVDDHFGVASATIKYRMKTS